MDDQNPPDQSVQKLKIKIGGAEFDGEGPSVLLEKQLERFLGLVEKLGPGAVAVASALQAHQAPGASAPHAVAAPGARGSQPAVAAEQPSEAVVVTVPPPSTTPGGTFITEDMLNRVFRRDADAVSLLALPRTDDGGADALVLLVYGFQKLLNRTAVTGYALIRAARQSGVNLPRVDLPLNKRSEYVLAAGNNRGRVYSLNNRGVAYAEGVLRKTLE
ncbi:MAG: hypothetical protein H7A18_10415 [Sinobacteraceae bacterium]|nr:hypothetical protein [Nevskiaceae bacterium]MCP5472470.1 hypothetical protein [Nevskiaceae bacterium]